MEIYTYNLRIPKDKRSELQVQGQPRLKESLIPKTTEMIAKDLSL